MLRKSINILAMAACRMELPIGAVNLRSPTSAFACVRRPPHSHHLNATTPRIRGSAKDSEAHSATTDRKPYRRWAHWTLRQKAEGAMNAANGCLYPT
jgi:hypothetical protein